ncbi:MAG: hypothetical protein ABJB74_11885 [Gemmatimonas sp.]
MFITIPSSATAQTTIPLRELPPAEKLSPEKFQNVFAVRQIGDGKVLVNDGVRMRLSMLDAELKLSSIVLDSASTATAKYGNRATPIIAYLGDSTFFPDFDSRVLLVIDPHGKIARSVALPYTNHLSQLWISASGVDGNGNLVLRPNPPTKPKNSAPDPSTGYTTVVNNTPDSAAIVRDNFDTRKVDTIARVQYPSGMRNEIVRNGDGDMVKSHATVIPLQNQDVWAMLSDGTLAVVRSHDYHVDLRRTDGTWQSGEKLPFDWKLLTQAEKQRLVDSTRRMIDTQVQEVENRDGKKAARYKKTRIIQTMASATLGIPLPPEATKAQIEAFADYEIVLDVVIASQLPDYYPALSLGAANADADGNLWILPATSSNGNDGRLVYDVIDNNAKFVTRVRLPAQRSIAGFGKNGIVYLRYREPDGQWRVERTRWR